MTNEDILFAIGDISDYRITAARLAPNKKRVSSRVKWIIAAAAVLALVVAGRFALTRNGMMPEPAGEQACYVPGVTYNGVFYQKYEYYLYNGDKDFSGGYEGFADEPIEGTNYYTMKGADPEFAICSGNSVNISGSFAKKCKYGSEIFEDQLHIGGNVRNVAFEKQDSWNNGSGIIRRYNGDMTLIDSLIESMDEAKLKDMEDMPGTTYDSYLWGAEPGTETEKRITAHDLIQYRLYLALDNDFVVRLALHEGGYVSFDAINFYVEVEDEVFDRVIEELGNSTGNISNNAFAAQDDESFYYLRKVDNPDAVMQSYELMKTDAETGEESVIYSGDNLSYLNITEDWLYFIGGMEGQIFRIRKDGSDLSNLNEALTFVNAMVVNSGCIYYRASDSDQIKTLYSFDLATGEISALCQMGRLCSGLVANEGWIYYSVCENDEWKTYRIRTDGTDNSLLGDFQLYSACVEGDRLYYLDDNLQICSVGLEGGETSLFAGGVSAIRINASKGWIYYSDTAAIYRIRTDVSQETKLCDFPSSINVDINIVGDWLYIRGDGVETQRISIAE